MNIENVLQALVDATEFSQLPLRQNVDIIKIELTKQCPLKVIVYTMDSSLYYLTETKSVMDNAPLVLQAMMDVCA